MLRLEREYRSLSIANFYFSSRQKFSRLSRREKYINRVETKRIGRGGLARSGARFGQRTLLLSFLEEQKQKTRMMLPFPLLRFYDMTKRTETECRRLCSAPLPPRFRVIQFYGPARLYPGISLLIPLENGGEVGDAIRLFAAGL